jgi:hypothetical protein
MQVECYVERGIVKNWNRHVSCRYALAAHLLAGSQEGLDISQSYDSTSRPNPFELSNILIAFASDDNRAGKLT